MSPALRTVLAFLAGFIVLVNPCWPCGEPTTQATAEPTAQLAITDGDGVIRIGEQIHASLVLPRGSDLPVGSLHRGGCTTLHFRVEPSQGWHDPWADWYYSGILEHAGGEGPSACGVPGAVPIVADWLTGKVRIPPPPPPQIGFTLNDWIEFDRPGKYKISVTYTIRHRTDKEWKDDPFDKQHTAKWVQLETPPIEITVLPEAVNVPDRAQAALTYVRSPAFERDWNSYPHWVNYSHSESVVPILVETFAHDSSGHRGLITSPHQELVVRAMEKQIADAQASISFSYLETLAFVAARLKHPQLFHGREEDLWTPQWEADSRARNQAILTALGEHTRQLLDSIPQKQERAQMDSLKAALTILARWRVPNGSSLRKQAARQAVRMWTSTAEDPYVYEEHLKVIASPALLPFLRKSDDREQAMRWTYRIAPQEARQRLLAAIAHGQWIEAYGWAQAIPAPQPASPELDRLLRKALRADLHDDYKEQLRDAILLKHGSAQLVPIVEHELPLYECMSRPDWRRFLLKHQGKVAEENMLRLYRELSVTADCDPDEQLQEIVSVDLDEGWHGYWSAAIQEVVISQLHKNLVSNRSLVADAAKLIGRFGTVDSKQHLWDALMRVHNALPKPRPGDPPSDERSDDNPDVAMIHSIMYGWHWTLTHDDVQRLRGVCGSDCSSLNWVRYAEDVQQIYVYDDFNRQRRYNVKLAPFATDFEDIRTWIALHPRGTRFSIQSFIGMTQPTPGQAEQQYPEVVALLHELGMELVNPNAWDEFGRCTRIAPEKLQAEKQ